MIILAAADILIWGYIGYLVIIRTVKHLRKEKSSGKNT